MALVTTMKTTIRQHANMTLGIVVQKPVLVHHGTTDMNAVRSITTVWTPIAAPRKKLMSLRLTTMLPTWKEHLC
jgi:hypothetical protein